MAFNKDSGYGRLSAMLLQNGIASFGKTFIVMPTTDTNYSRFAAMFGPDNDGKVRMVSTLLEAYNLCTSNANDVIILAANGTHSITTGIAWTKSRIHVIGLDGGDRQVQQGSRIQNATADATAYVIKVTGARNSFRNIKFIQASTAATALTVVQDGGEGTLYKNCSFVFGVADNLDETTAHEFLAGSDSANFINCTFGADTLLTSAARSVFHIDQVTSGQEFKSNILENCNFMLSSSSATASFVRLDSTDDILFSNLFKDCSFLASINTAGGIALTSGAIQTGTGTSKGTIYLVRPSTFNCGVSTATSGFNAGVQVVAAASVATAIKGIQPTA